MLSVANWDTPNLIKRSKSLFQKIAAGFLREPTARKATSKSMRVNASVMFKDGSALKTYVPRYSKLSPGGTDWVDVKLVQDLGHQPACDDLADGGVFWAHSNRVDSLHDIVERAAASGSRQATVRLGPGRHILTHPLLLDQRHSGLHFVGGGSASISGAVEIGASAPQNGSKNVTGWSVVGPAKCSGCSEIWRAAIPSGADSRQLYLLWAIYRSTTNGVLQSTLFGSIYYVFPG